MPAQKRYFRRVTSDLLRENDVKTFDLPRGYDLESIMIRVSGTANVTTAGAAVRAMAPCQLLKRVEVMIDGKNTIASVPGFSLVKNRNREQYGRLIPPTAAAIAAYAVELFGTLDLALIDGVRPKDSNLRTYGLSQHQIRLTTGALADLFTGAPAGTMTVFNVEIYIVETEEMANDAGDVSLPLFLQKRTYQDTDVLASNNNLQLQLPVGNLLRGVTILATDAGEPSNSIINEITLAAGLDVRFKMPGIGTQLMNAVNFAPFGASAVGVWAGYNQMPTGIYVVDMMTNGPRDVNITNAWNLEGIPEAKLVLDVTGGANRKLTIVTEEFIRLR